jgi:hypothetical protein
MYLIIGFLSPVFSALLVMIAQYPHVGYSGIKFVHPINAHIALTIDTGLIAVIGMKFVQPVRYP